MQQFRLVEQQRLLDRYARFTDDKVTTEEQLIETLNRLCAKQNNVFTIYSPDGSSLLVAVSSEHVYIEYSNQELNHRHLIATYKIGKYSTHNKALDHEYFPLPLFEEHEVYMEQQLPKGISKEERVEFIIGGTPTRIPISKCVSIEAMIQIVRHFYKTQGILDEFEWVES